MSEKVRVTNTTKYDIGLVTMSNIGRNIKAGSFIMMEKEDVEYNMGIAPSLFENPPQLVVADEDLNSMMGVDTENMEICDEATVEKYLKGTVAKLRTWLSENNKPHVLEMVYQTAKRMDLPMSKVKVVEEFVPIRKLSDE